jgi:hypothetical protein
MFVHHHHHGSLHSNADTPCVDNHKPALSSDDAPSHARLKPSIPGKTDSYDLSFTDDDGTYAYAGSRNTSSKQYVLHFDPARKAFILDKIDSTFNMNVTRLPGNSDSARLSRQYPPLDSQPAAATGSATAATTTAAAAPPSRGASAKKSTAPKSASKPAAAKAQPKETKRKMEKKQPPPKEVALSFPEPQKEKPKPKRNSFDEEEEEDEDDDGGLLIEYPGGDSAAAKQTDFSPAFPPPRRFDDFMDKMDSEADDADGESDDEPDMDFKLPSPVNHARPEPMDHTVEERHDESMEGGDLEDDLEKEMEEAFEDMANSQEATPHGGDESEISEED